MDRATVYASMTVPSRQSTTARSGTDDGSATHVRSDPVYVLKAQLFRVLGHPIRIRILELLSDGERTVGALQAALGLDSSSTSQHLAALRQQGVLASRKVGTSVLYRIRDPRVTHLLAAAKEILSSALSESQTLLSGLADEPSGRSRRR
jgi:DNA-binding transcriptional ArsR family regulator